MCVSGTSRTPSVSSVLEQESTPPGGEPASGLFSLVFSSHVHPAGLKDLDWFNPSMDQQSTNIVPNPVDLRKHGQTAARGPFEARLNLEELYYTIYQQLF